MDRIMFNFHQFCMSYHAFRGAGIGVMQALYFSAKIVWERKTIAKPISDYQKEIWLEMKCLGERTDEAGGING